MLQQTCALWTKWGSSHWCYNTMNDMEQLDLREEQTMAPRLTPSNTWWTSYQNWVHFENKPLKEHITQLSLAINPFLSKFNFKGKSKVQKLSRDPDTGFLPRFLSALELFSRIFLLIKSVRLLNITSCSWTLTLKNFQTQLTERFFIPSVFCLSKTNKWTNKQMYSQKM